DDLQLSKDEIKALLKSAKGRVGKLRKIKFPGKHADRVKEKANEIIKQHDKDGDGKLSAEELEEALQGRKDQCNRWKKRRPPAPAPENPTTDSGKVPDNSGDSMGKTKEKFRH